jgi:hypothetical protein
MKAIIILTLIVCAISIRCQPAKDEPNESFEEPTINYEEEKKAILEVVENESAAFWNKDFDAYAACWVHDDYVRTMGWWQDGGVTVVEGWKERESRTRSHMEASPEPNPSATRVKRANVNLRIYKDIAWMTFDQYGEDTGDSLMDMPGLSRETRIFEKHDGKWKIAYVGWLLDGGKE